ncbi:MAG: hypothetical protein M3Y91_13730 [Actinomycetota bacterium]|nr:hypothetical protein [Actinomycetota bacterium]
MASDAPDFRLQRSTSPEGQGHARARWDAFYDLVDEDVMADAYGGNHPVRLDDVDPDVASDIASNVREETELIGFWVAWHRAGGFVNLEYAGWHKATIFRKLRRFRAYFGMHPDEYRFDWIALDLEAVWEDALRRRLEPEPDPVP